MPVTGINVRNGWCRVIGRRYPSGSSRYPLRNVGYLDSEKVTLGRPGDGEAPSESRISGGACSFRASEMVWARCRSTPAGGQSAAQARVERVDMSLKVRTRILPAGRPRTGRSATERRRVWLGWHGRDGSVHRTPSGGCRYLFHPANAGILPSIQGRVPTLRLRIETLRTVSRALSTAMWSGSRCTSVDEATQRNSVCSRFSDRRLQTSAVRRRGGFSYVVARALPAR